MRKYVQHGAMRPNIPLKPPNKPSYLPFQSHRALSHAPRRGGRTQAWLVEVPHVMTLLRVDHDGGDGKQVWRGDQVCECVGAQAGCGSIEADFWLWN